MNLHAAAPAALVETEVEAKLAAAARLWADWQAGRLIIEPWTAPAPSSKLAAILDIILRDEITHVATGDRWFRHLCAERGLVPEVTWRRLVLEYDMPKPRRPFNEAALLAAGFSADELTGW